MVLTSVYSDVSKKLSNGSVTKHRLKKQNRKLPEDRRVFTANVSVEEYETVHKYMDYWGFDNFTAFFRHNISSMRKFLKEKEMESLDKS